MLHIEENVCLLCGQKCKSWMSKTTGDNSFRCKNCGRYDVTDEFIEDHDDFNREGIIAYIKKMRAKGHDCFQITCGTFKIMGG